MRKMKFELSILHQKPYIQIPFKIDNWQLVKAVESFFKFLELPEEEKNYIDTKISPMHRRGELGYRHRDPADDIYNDSKDFFHYHPIVQKEFANFINSNKIVSDFISKAQPIWQAVYDTMYEIISVFETEYSGSLDKVFNSKEPHIVLRFLKYEFSKSSQYLAQPHFDSGSFTLALAESCPGLRIGTGPSDLEIINHQDSNAIFMVSSNYKKIIDDDRLKPAWHDVIQMDKSKLGKSFARWAIVAFIDGHSVEALPRSETHKWSTPS